MKKLMICLAAMIACFPATAVLGQTPLDGYIREGLRNNLALQQEEFSLESSLQALKEARGMFLPSISIEARYSFAGGGREIDFPVGDLFNPIHQTLNQLIAAQGAPPLFPTDLANQQIPFLRPREHETKLRVVQPVFQPQILHNVRIKSMQKKSQQAGFNAFSRQLVSDIKIAYYTYLQALGVSNILTDTRKLLEENLRVSRSLEANHKVTAEVPLRSEAELLALEGRIADSHKNVTMAAAYFNFLLNRPLDATVEVGENPSPENELELPALRESALRHREEFFQVQSALEAARHGIKLRDAAWLPAVTAVVDYGFQGEDYRFGKADDYWMASLVMSWNLYRGGRDKAQKTQALLQKKQLEAGLEQLEAKILLQVTEAWHRADVARRTLASQEAQVRSRKEALRIVARKYREGMVPQIEFIQAQNQATAAELEYAIGGYGLLMEEARLERVCALYPLEKTTNNAHKE